jgi:hypothetical protein
MKWPTPYKLRIICVGVITTIVIAAMILAIKWLMDNTMLFQGTI